METRRAFLGKLIVAGSVLAATHTVQAGERNGLLGNLGKPSGSFVDLLRTPDLVMVYTDRGNRKLAPAGDGRWTSSDTEVTTIVRDGALHVALASPHTAVQRIHVRWHGDLTRCTLFLGDAWERGYGDLGWRPCIPERVMPWYMLSHDGHTTHGYGVRTGAKALCFWQADAAGISLWADVKSGGAGVELGARLLDVCAVVCRQGHGAETEFQAHQDFCRKMCPKPRLADHPIYGINDWYYAYGNNTASGILEDGKRLVELSPQGGNRPYCVIDAGWQPSGGADGGPWDIGNDRFPSMPGLAGQIKEIGARPGIWIRPLDGKDSKAPETWRLSRDRSLLDPTHPEVLNQVKTDMARLHAWGYQLIKHDFSTVDILGKWGFDMGADPAGSGWHFSSRNQTNAEIILDFYRTIREVAGDAVVIGCNTIGHLTAGIFEISRIGDDTSGRVWERTRKMGVNSLAFRAAHQGTFYAADGDCVGLTKDVPWELNRQWLDLLSRSGTPLFVSAQADAVGAAQKDALRKAYAHAAQHQPVAEPLDWKKTGTPAHWKLRGAPS